MVAVTEDAMEEMRRQLKLTQDEVRRVAAIQMTHQEFLTDTNVDRMQCMMWKSYSDAYPELDSAMKTLDEKTTRIDSDLQWAKGQIVTEVNEQLKNDIAALQK